jgi:glycosyltransferase involved in cell wall biosynthesis
LLKRHRFDAVVSFTPKAGLLAAIAGRLADVGVRVHWFTGQVWANKRNPCRYLLKVADRIMVRSLTFTLVDGHSQRRFLIEQGVIDADSSAVLNHGSISGVDLERFKPNQQFRYSIRAELGIFANQTVFIFLGRITWEKGLLELAKAFSSLNPSSQPHLILAGPDEKFTARHLDKILASAKGRYHFTGSLRFPEEYLAASDVLVLPSHREGFGTSVIEAAAMQIPAVVSDIYGLRDSVIEGETGLRFHCGDIEELRTRLETLCAEPANIRRMGRAARNRAVLLFNQDDVLVAFETFLLQKVDEKRLDARGRKEVRHEVNIE